MSEIQTSNWSETAANNNATPPNGWPEGQAPSTVNDCAREVMAAVRRWFGRWHGIDESEALISSGGTSTAITVTYSNAPASLFTGLEVGFKVTTTCGADPTLNVNSLGAKNIQKIVNGVYSNILSGDLVATQHVKMKYDGTLDKWILLTGTGVEGKHKLWIPATQMRATAAAAGPSTADVAAGTNGQYTTLDFDQTAQENAHFQVSFPSSWNEGTVTFVPIWTAAAGSGGVTWALNGAAFSNDDALSITFSGSVSSADTLIATGDMHRGPESSALTIDGTPAANDIVLFRILRNVADAGDTLTADARLLGIELYFITDATTDSA